MHAVIILSWEADFQETQNIVVMDEIYLNEIMSNNKIDQFYSAFIMSFFFFFFIVYNINNLFQCNVLIYRIKCYIL
jgi:hypothetical protein